MIAVRFAPRLAASVLVLSLVAGCGSDDPSADTGDADSSGAADSELVEDLTDGGEEPTAEEPCDEGMLPLLSVVNEATGEAFVTCDGGYSDEAGRYFDVQRLAYATPELAAAEWEPFGAIGDGEPAEGDGWAGVYDGSRGLLLGSSGTTFISIKFQEEEPGTTDVEDVLHDIFEVVLAHDGPIRSA